MVGVWTRGQRVDGEVVDNEFASHFEEAGKRISARFRADAFDRSGAWPGPGRCGGGPLTDQRYYLPPP